MNAAPSSPIPDLPTHRVSIIIEPFNQRIDFQPTSDSLENFWVTVTYMAVRDSEAEEVDRIIVPAPKIPDLFQFWMGFPGATVDFDPDHLAPGLIRS